MRRRERNNAAEKGVRNDIWGETAKWLLNCKNETFSNRKGFNDVCIVWSVSIKKSVFSSGLELRKIGQKCPTYKNDKKSSYFFRKFVLTLQTCFYIIRIVSLETLLFIAKRFAVLGSLEGPYGNH